MSPTLLIITTTTIYYANKPDTEFRRLKLKQFLVMNGMQGEPLHFSVFSRSIVNLGRNGIHGPSPR